MYAIFYLLSVLIIAILIYRLYVVYKNSFVGRFNNTSFPILQTSPIHPEVLKTYPDIFLYPVDVSPCIKENAFDEKGLVLYMDNGVRRFHPTLACLYALVCFEKYVKDNDQAALSNFNNHIQYIEDNIQLTPDGKGIFIPFEFDFFNEKAPWTSGITSAFLISAIARKYMLSKEEKYVDILNKAFDFLNRPSENMKGARFSGEGIDLWYEEDPHNFHILNGNIYAVFGVYELSKCVNNRELTKTLELAYKSIKDNLYRYDLGFYSKYDLSKGSVCNGSYHRLHINILHALSVITGDPLYKTYSEKFDGYTKSVISKSRLLFYLYFKSILAKAKITI